MRIAVIGSGAIGGVTAAYMALGGEDVTVLCRSEKTAQRIRSEGLRITGLRGERTVRLNVTSALPTDSGLFDCCIVATKAGEMPDAVRAILPRLTPQGLIVSMQNGMCAELLEEAAGKGRGAVAIVTWSSTRTGETELQITGEGGFVLGRTDGNIDERLTQVKSALDKMAPTRITDNIRSEIYSKLIINSGITCGGALYGRELGVMLRDSAVRRFFIAIAREDMALAEAMGIQVPAFGGKLDYYKFVRGNGPFDHIRRHALLLAIGLRYRHLISSSLTSLRRGQRTEAEWLNGWIARKARECGIPAPVNERTWQMVTELENGKRNPGPRNIKELMEGVKHDG